MSTSWSPSVRLPLASGNRTDGDQLVDIVVRPPLYLAVGGFWANDGEGPQRTLVVRRCPS